MAIDVRCAIRFLRAHAADHGLDPARFAGIGHSAGGHLVAMAGLVRDTEWVDGSVPRDQPAALRSVVGLSGAYDLTAMLSDDDGPPFGALAELLPGTLDGLRQRARAASPLTHVRPDAPPFLLCHGDMDETCPPGQAEAFADALRAAGNHDVTLRVFEGAGHGVAGEEGLMELVDDFLIRTLLE
ncbi:MAG: alpha/beta fold hydrolase [Candidatus Brocadiia bacterium]